MAMEKHKMLVQLLMLKTEQGGVHWKKSPQDGAFKATFRENFVEIQHETFSPEFQRYTMNIQDGWGDIIENFSDVDLEAEDGLGDPSGSWFHLMKNLYQAARRIASGSDRALSSIIEELGG